MIRRAEKYLYGMTELHLCKQVMERSRYISTEILIGGRLFSKTSALLLFVDTAVKLVVNKCSSKIDYHYLPLFRIICAFTSGLSLHFPFESTFLHLRNLYATHTEAHFFTF